MKKVPAVYVKRGDFDIWPYHDHVAIPITGRGRHTNETMTACYEEFARITGIKLKPGEIAKVCITGERVKR